MINDPDTPDEMGTDEMQHEEIRKDEPSSVETEPETDIESDAEPVADDEVGVDADVDTDTDTDTEMPAEFEDDLPVDAQSPEIKGRLYMVGTPIGNPDDITLRGRHTLEFADIVVCEEYKVGARLLRIYNVSKKLLEMNEHNEEESSDEVIELVKNGKTVAVISDAGLPLLADPGSALMRKARAIGIQPMIVPGVSSVMTALMISGFSMERFEFAGFLPRKTDDRRQAASDLASHSGTLAILETPYRLRSLLAALADAMPDRNAAIAFNLTMPAEAVVRGTLAELDERMGQRRAKGEFVVVLDRYNASESGTAREARAAARRDQEENRRDERPARERSFGSGAAPRRSSGDTGDRPFRHSAPPGRSAAGLRREGGSYGGPKRNFGPRRDDAGRGSSGPQRDDRRGGFAPRRDDAGRGSSGPQRDDRRGGFAPRRDDAGRGSSGPQRDDRRGGFAPRRDDAGRGGPPRRDGEKRGGFAPRRDDDKRGGFAPRRDDDKRAGFAPRRDGDKRGGFAPRRDDDKRGGFAPRRDGDKRGGFAPRRDDDKRGGFAPRRDDDKRGGFAPRRDDDKRGGFAPRRDDAGRGSAPRRDDRRSDPGSRRGDSGRNAGFEPPRKKGPRDGNNDRRRNDGDNGIE